MKLLAASSRKCLRSWRRSRWLGLNWSQSRQCPVLTGTETIYLHVVYHAKSRVQAGRLKLEALEVPDIFQFYIQTNLCLCKKCGNVPRRSDESIKTGNGTHVCSEESNAPALVLKHANVGINSICLELFCVPHAFNASYFSHSDICITSVVWLPMQHTALRFYR